MRARVLELGGDTLLFGMRGRSGRLSASPEEIVERRNELLATAAANGSEPAVAITVGPTEEAEPPETAQTNAERRRNAVITGERIADQPGQLWFYGAALRCNKAEPLE